MEDMNKRLAKRNLPLINTRLIEEYDYKTKEQIPVPYEPFAVQIDVVYHYFVYELSSEFDQKNIAGVDVQFEGVVDLIEKDENAKVFKLADNNLFKYLDNCSCDACKKTIGRNKYIVFSKVGKPVESRDDLVVLGTTCAKDYFPFNVVDYVGNLESFYVELFGECDDSMGFGFRDSSYVNIQRLFRYVGAVTKDFVVYEKDNVTRTHVECLIKGKKDPDEKFEYVSPKTSWQDMQQWIKDCYSIGNCCGEFECNIHSIMFEPQKHEDDPIKLRDYINMKYLGLACYAFVGAKKWHDRQTAKLAKQQAYLDSISNEYVGNVGDKFEMQLMFERTIGFEGDYSYTFFHFFRDQAGHIFKWSSAKKLYEAFCSLNGRSDWIDFEPGKTYVLKGTIKAHNEYKDVKQTCITRCKVLKDPYDSHLFDKKQIAKVLDDLQAQRAAEKHDDLAIFDIA